MGRNNNKHFLPIIILICTIVVTLVAHMLSDFLGIKGVHKVYEILKYFQCISISLIGLLMVETYKRSISSVWYWIFNIGLMFSTLFSVYNFISVYLEYLNSIINRLFFIVAYIQAAMSVHFFAQINPQRFVSIFAMIEFAGVFFVLIYYLIKNAKLPVIRLIAYFNKTVSNKKYQVLYQENISLGFLYNAIP